MEEKENVYETAGTENGTQVREATEDGKKGRDKEISTVLGKFKDVDALARAYGALQSEFTRRSQRLKELEKEAEERKKTAEEALDAAIGVEKLRKNAEERRAENKAFNRFVSELEVSRDKVDGRTDEEWNPESEELDGLEEVVAETAAESKRGQGADEQEGLKTPVLEKVEAFVGKSREMDALSSEALYEQVSRDEKVRLKIIGEYLASVGKTVAPLMRGGAGTLAAPPIKAKTLGEAGDMALRYFKRETQA